MGVKKFGPFVLERMIGRGGMGAVYRAHDENTNQTVAVKALLLPLERERERFEAEISTLRRLRHENIVKQGLKLCKMTFHLRLSVLNSVFVSLFIKRIFTFFGSFRIKTFKRFNCY